MLLTHVGGTGAAPFYGLRPLEWCSLLVMDPRGEPGEPCGLYHAGPAHERRSLPPRH